MKRNKVLLGLFVGLMTLAGGVLNAQTGDKFYEVGPANIAGQITSIVSDSRDTTGTSAYAGAANGGLFFRSEKRDILRQFYTALGYDEDRVAVLADTAIWHRVPYFDNATNREVILPISCMFGGPDGMIYIGTGDGYVQNESNYSRMSTAGKGIYRFDPQTLTYTRLAETNTPDFAAVNGLDYYRNADTFYLFAATSKGLFRWRVVSNNWTNAYPVRVMEGFIDEVKVSRKLRTAYFSTQFNLYKIGDVTDHNISSRVACITSSNPAFAQARRIRIAIAPNDPDFVYAMTVNSAGMMENLYLTRNEQTWLPIATSTVTPFNGFTNGITAGAITVDPTNPRRVIIAGDNIWVGRGYVDGALYQWTSSSYSEHMLNGGDYMSQVFTMPFYVHSGIHTIVPVRTIGSYTINGVREEFDGLNYYIGTNGGIYISGPEFNYYTNVNHGLNTTAVTSISVAPDGTLVTGARDNSSPVIEPILTHAGGQPTISWYDNGKLGNFNHDANILFQNGTGGATAASAFQQYSTQTRRTIFTSNSGGSFGRAWTDYLDYTNTTAWTAGSAFSGDGANYGIAGGPEIGSLYLWETTNNTVFNNYIRQGIDTLGYIIRGTDTIWINDTARNGNQSGSKFRIQRGDKINFHSRAHNNYPFEYTFTSSTTAKDTLTVLNPIQSRMVAIGDFPNSGASGRQAPITRCVWFSWNPTDFTKVWDSLTYIQSMTNASLAEPLHLWSPIFGIQRIAGTATENLFPRNAVISRDGLNVYVSAYDTAANKSVLFRIKGFETIDFTAANYKIYTDIDFQKGRNSLLSIDTFYVDTIDSSFYFPRPISSLAIDPRPGYDRLIITFDGQSDNYPNVAVINNPRTNWSSIDTIPITGKRNVPVFCALVEDATGTLYAGTANGVYTKSGDNAWEVYENIPDIPVTAITQQTMKLPVRHSVTHTGITKENNAFAKTKWPRAIYFGTYGRGIFMDMTYVTDTVNEIVDSVDYTPVPIPAVNSIGLNSVSLYPNPVSTEATLNVNAAAAGTAQLRVYDLNGRLVIDRQLGFASEGENLYTLQTENLGKGMYLVNVIIGGHTAATKMMVR